MSISEDSTGQRDNAAQIERMTIPPFAAEGGSDGGALIIGETVSDLFRNARLEGALESILVLVITHGGHPLAA